MQNGLANPDNAGAASTDYLHLFGLTGLAYMWAHDGQGGAGQDRRRRQPIPSTPTSWSTGRYFLERIAAGRRRATWPS